VTETRQPNTAPAASATEARRGSSRVGLIYGLGAYSIWGFIPLYFRALSSVPPVIILCHRVFWSALFLGVVITIRGEWKSIWPIVRNRRKLLLLSAGAVLIALNWLIFIYAVVARQVLQASLGYFITPLLSIALGMLFLRERLRGLQWLAVLIAVAGVANLALRGSGLPWIAVSLACSFSLYGLVRKKVDVNSLHGLLVETVILLPLALLLLAVLPAAKSAPATLGILSLSGFITAIPLLLFGAAVRRLELATIGFLQYVGPTLQFLVAIFLFQEALDPAKLASFALCWLAIAVYIIESLLTRHPQAVADEPE
jgi:chloramphenicol-sensitive protein RarD